MKCRTVILVLLIWSSFAADLTAQDSSAVWVPAIGAPQYFAVLVGDIDRSVQWYTTAFGLEETSRSQAEDGSWQIVNLENAGLSVELIRDNRAQEVKRALGFFKVGFRVPDVHIVADRVQRASAERPRVVEFAEQGLFILQLRDPDGNIIQLTSPLQ